MYLNDFNQILPDLYLGSYDALFGKKLNDIKITHIISVASDDDTPIYSKKIPQTRIEMKGKMSKSELIEKIKEVAEILNQLLEKKEIVYIHCFEGISRSASCVIYYLFKFHHLSYKESFEFVKERRNSINPYHNMLECLEELTK